MEWYEVILIILAGFVAGIINTLAGSGSIVTIAMLSFLGLDANQANGTNRIGVFFQSIVGAKTFIKNRNTLPKTIGWQLVPSVIGSILGSILATNLPPAQMDTIIGIIFIVLLFIILYNPTAWLRKQSVEKINFKSPLSILIFFGIGIYGGFIQAGVGIFLLSALVLYAGYNLNTSNAIKLICVLAFTIPALTIFILKGQIVWMYGLLMSIGQSAGAYLAAKFAMNNEKTNIFVRYLLIAIIIVSIIKFLKLPQLLL